VELVATTVEERLVEVWENVEKHRASIADQVQEVKIVAREVKDQGSKGTKRTIHVG
jgi:hypothetical protein